MVSTLANGGKQDLINKTNKKKRKGIIVVTEEDNWWILLQIREAEKWPNLVICRSSLTLHFLANCKHWEEVKQSKNNKFLLYITIHQFKACPATGGVTSNPMKAELTKMA